MKVILENTSGVFHGGYTHYYLTKNNPDAPLGLSEQPCLCTEFICKILRRPFKDCPIFITLELSPTYKPFFTKAAVIDGINSIGWSCLKVDVKGESHHCPSWLNYYLDDHNTNHCYFRICAIKPRR